MMGWRNSLADSSKRRRDNVLMCLDPVMLGKEEAESRAEIIIKSLEGLLV